MVLARSHLFEVHVRVVVIMLPPVYQNAVVSRFGLFLFAAVVTAEGLMLSATIILKIGTTSSSFCLD